LQLITLAGTPLDDAPARHRGLYVHKTTPTREKMRGSGRIRTPNPSKRTAADLRLRPCGCRHRLLLY